MTNLELFRNKLDELKVFDTNYSSDIKEIVNSFTTSLNDKMKLQLFIHYLSVWASQFRIPVFLNRQYIPINSIGFLFAPSGSGKDTTINQIKNIFKNSFESINAYLQEKNIEQARARAEKSTNEYTSYLEYIPPLEIGISTAEGLLSSIQSLQKFDIGSLNINSNELLAELQSNPNINALLSTLAELYDIGNKNSKQLKDKSNQVGHLSNVFLNGLFCSSFNMITDSSTRNKLLNEFKSRFARRSSITFTKESKELEEVNDIDSWLEKEKVMIYESNLIYDKFQEYFDEVTLTRLNNKLPYLALTSEALDVYLLYRQYSVLLERTLKDENLLDKFSFINKVHRSFQALKLSGTLAIFNKHDKIEKNDMIDAIKIVEIINEDTDLYESELTKENYEILIDFCNSKNKNELEIPFYLFKKSNLVVGTNFKTGLDNLVALANSYSKDSLLSIDYNKQIVSYRKFEQSTEYEVSYFKSNSNNKEDKAKELYKSFTTANITFDRLGNLLKSGVTYNNFTFKDGKRSNDTINGYTNWLVFDIDKSILDIDELHKYLSEFVNHHICSTSDKSNKFKYRVIFPLTNKVKFDSKIYKSILQGIAKEYLPCITPDFLPMSQAFYSYTDSIVLSTLDKENIEIKPFIEQTINKVNTKPLTKKDKAMLIENAESTFSYAYWRNEGSRNLNLIRVINHAFDLDASYNQIEWLINNINSTFEIPLSEEEIEKSIMPHLRKKFKE